MNYSSIHDRFIEYFRSTEPSERLKKRDENDLRLSEKYLYIEKHHIIPRSQGGDNSETNLVNLLPEEHVFIHLLRFKAFGHPSDMYAFRFCLNGIANKDLFKNKLYVSLGKDVRKYYALLRHFKSRFRKKYGWQTEDGKKRISAARKGKFPAVDAKTGKNVGSVDCNHPKVLSGEWVHHSKGYVTVFDDKIGKKVRIKTSEKSEHHHGLTKSDGSNNANYSGLTDDQIIGYALDFVKEYQIIPSLGLLKRYLAMKNIKMIKMLVGWRFNEFGGGCKGYVKRLEKETNLLYKPNTKQYAQVSRKFKD